MDMQEWADTVLRTALAGTHGLITIACPARCYHDDKPVQLDLADFNADGEQLCPGCGRTVRIDREKIVIEVS